MSSLFDPYYVLILRSMACVDGAGTYTFRPRTEPRVRLSPAEKQAPTPLLREPGEVELSHDVQFSFHRKHKLIAPPTLIRLDCRTCAPPSPPPAWTTPPAPHATTGPWTTQNAQPKPPLALPRRPSTAARLGAPQAAAPTLCSWTSWVSGSGIMLYLQRLRPIDNYSTLLPRIRGIDRYHCQLSKYAGARRRRGGGENGVLCTTTCRNTFLMSYEKHPLTFCTKQVNPFPRTAL